MTKIFFVQKVYIDIKMKTKIIDYTMNMQIYNIEDLKRI